MKQIQTPLIILDLVVGVLLMASILVQTPKATGLGGTIGGGDSGLGGGYRTRRGLERQIYWTSWLLAGVFLLVSAANIYISDYLASHP